ncbi:MAG: hypothetical protein ACRCSK_03285 [Fusobacteriaceae bacterium]
MKKILAVFIFSFTFIFSNVLFAEGEKFSGTSDFFMQVKAGGDFLGAYRTIDNEKTSGLGYSAALHSFWGFKFENGDDLYLGVGIAYQKQPNQFEFNGEKIEQITTIPFYFVLRNSFNIGGEFRPFMEYHLGHGAVVQSQKNYNVIPGFYFAVGGGVEYKNITLDIMYMYNDQYLKVKDQNLASNIMYSRGIISLGYKFF